MFCSSADGNSHKRHDALKDDPQRALLPCKTVANEFLEHRRVGSSSAWSSKSTTRGAVEKKHEVFITKVSQGIDLLQRGDETQVETIWGKVLKIRDGAGDYEVKLDALSHTMAALKKELRISNKTLLWVADNVSLSVTAIKRKRRVFLASKDAELDSLGPEEVYKDEWEQQKVESAALLNAVVNRLVPYYGIYALAIPSLLAG